MTLVNINIIRQFYCRMQLLHHGDITRPKNSKFALWEPLATTAVKYPDLVTIGKADMSVFYLKDADTNIDTPVSAKGDFCTGFGSVWEKGMPVDVEKAYFTNLFDTLRSLVSMSDIAPANLRIPAVQALEEGLLTEPDADLAHLAGKKIFCLGTSIIESARKQMMKLAKMYKIEVTALCRPGKYKKFFLDQNHDTYLAPLKKSKSDDILFLSFLGNELIKKSSHKKDPVTRKFHVENPTILTGEAYNLLVADTMHMVNAVRKRFNGSIFVLGPIPRHLEDCCDDPTHVIKDEIGVKVNMLKYTNVFSAQLKRDLTLPADTFYVDYRQVFGDALDNGALEDGVHLEEGHCKKLAHALLGGYEVFLPAPAPADPDSSFADALQAVEIITVDVPVDKADELGDNINWDDLDYD